MSNDSNKEYQTYYCKVHKKTIYYFSKHSHVTGKYHCWDCIRDENLKKDKPHEHG